MIGAIHSKLVSYQPGRTREPQLEAAESIEQIAAPHIKFKLRPGIMYTNGFGEMSADDVKFPFERIIVPAVESSACVTRSSGARLSSREVLLPCRTMIALAAPYAGCWRSQTCAGTKLPSN